MPGSHELGALFTCSSAATQGFRVFILGFRAVAEAWGLTRFKSKLLKPFCISARREFPTVATVGFNRQGVGKHVRTRIKEFDPQSTDLRGFWLPKSLEWT